MIVRVKSAFNKLILISFLYTNNYCSLYRGCVKSSDTNFIKKGTIVGVVQKWQSRVRLNVDLSQLLI